MDIQSGNKYPSCALSNFAPHPFTLDGIEINSMEGFLQSLKFKNEDMQVHICTLVGFKAKKSGSHKNWQSTQTLYWKGKSIKRDSQDYQDLLDNAYGAMFDQNKSARSALLATNKATLTHSIGRRKINETVLTTKEFCGRLTRIRKWIQESEYMIF
jgi:predicted NAD-dependent protein-ADP-ribosyltransferase YbiA (DUF1768 family)